MTIIAVLIIYFVLLFAVSRLTQRHSTNEAFFRAERRSPWYMVAFGMVGASVSGVTFVSVPGMVLHSQMTYLQLCLGFILGYVMVAFVLLPLYYKLNLTSIYTYLGQRLGHRSYQTGAWFFLVSKMIGSAVKFYVVCLILQQFVFDELGIPFALNVVVMVLAIWLYTRKGGVRTLVFTDTIQTFCLMASLLLIIYIVVNRMGLTFEESVQAIVNDERSRVFVFDNFSSQNFWKMFFSGAFIVVAMTGLDQDMMQKNLTCKNLRDAQKDMCTYGLAFVPVNLLFLSLGVLLAQYFQANDIVLPTMGDRLLPMFVEDVSQSEFLQSLFSLGIVAASFSSADSALTSLTTSYCVDIRQRMDDEKLRKRAHLIICLLFVVCIMAFHLVNSKSLIDAIYTIVSYTYGPLLGLFAFGLFTKKAVRDSCVPMICVLSPILCFFIDKCYVSLTETHMGYELLLINGLLSFCGLWLFSRK